MFKTDETVRFGQILSARTLRYGKFNEYIIIIISRKGSVAVSVERQKSSHTTHSTDARDVT